MERSNFKSHLQCQFLESFILPFLLEHQEILQELNMKFYKGLRLEIMKLRLLLKSIL